MNKVLQRGYEGIGKMIERYKSLKKQNDFKIGVNCVFDMPNNFWR